MRQVLQFAFITICTVAVAQVTARQGDVKQTAFASPMVLEAPFPLTTDAKGSRVALTAFRNYECDGIALVTLMFDVLEHRTNQAKIQAAAIVKNRGHGDRLVDVLIETLSGAAVIDKCQIRRMDAEDHNKSATGKGVIFLPAGRVSAEPHLTMRITVTVMPNN